jgi:hypothetical protein
MPVLGKVLYKIRNKKLLCPKGKNELILNRGYLFCSCCGLRLTEVNLNLVVYCKTCNKLYADINSYNDHILFCKQEVLTNGRTPIIKRSN